MIIGLSYAGSSGASNPQAANAGAINSNLDNAAQMAANDEKGLDQKLQKQFHVANKQTFQMISLYNCLASGNCPDPVDKFDVYQKEMLITGPDVKGKTSMYEMLRVPNQPPLVTKITPASGVTASVHGSPPPTPTVEAISFMAGNSSLSSIAYAIEGAVYVGLTIYLFVVAWSRLLARDWFVFMIDISLWLILSSVLYVVFQGSTP